MSSEHKGMTHQHLARRSVLGGLAALGTSALLPVPHSFAAAKPRRIDVHHHIYPPEFLADIERLNPALGKQTAPHPYENWTPATAIEEMDRNGIATAMVSSVFPGTGSADPAPMRHMTREWNEYAARLAQDHRGRFGFFAAVPMPDVDGALTEIAYAIDTLGADGVGLFTSYSGKYPGDPAYLPVFAELDRRKAAVFFHPLAAPCCTATIPGVPQRDIEFPFDSTRAITSLLFSGNLMRFPNIRYIFCHGGGTMPMLAARIAELSKNDKKLQAAAPDGVEAILRRLYYDTANATGRAQMAALLEFAPVSQILYGSDFPYVTEETNLKGLGEDRLAKATRAAIERGNALRLWPRLAT